MSEPRYVDCMYTCVVLCLSQQCCALDRANVPCFSTNGFAKKKILRSRVFSYIWILPVCNPFPMFLRLIVTFVLAFNRHHHFNMDTFQFLMIATNFGRAETPQEAIYNTWIPMWVDSQTAACNSNVYEVPAVTNVWCAIMKCVYVAWGRAHVLSFMPACVVFVSYSSWENQVSWTYAVHNLSHFFYERERNFTCWCVTLACIGSRLLHASADFCCWYLKRDLCCVPPECNASFFCLFFADSKNKKPWDI